MIQNVYEDSIRIAPYCGEDFYRVLVTDPAHLRMQKINRFLKMIGEDSPVLFSDFTPRELDCIHGYLRGLSARQIGDELDISKRTAEHYLAKFQLLKSFVYNTS